MGNLALVGFALVGVVLMAGCGQAGGLPAASGTEGVGATQGTVAAPGEQGTVVVGTSEPTSGSVLGDPLVPRDASGSPLPQTPTVEVSAVLTPDASGTVTMTDADMSRNVEMKVGNTLVFDLGDIYEWTITAADPAVLSSPAMSPGASQNVYKALKAGQTTISAEGDPHCRKASPPCGMPSKAFSITVVVR